MPYRKHGYWYNTRFEPGKEHPVFVRRKDSPEAAEEVLLDVNALAAGHDYYRIGALEVVHKQIPELLLQRPAHADVLSEDAGCQVEEVAVIERVQASALRRGRCASPGQ